MTTTPTTTTAPSNGTGILYTEVPVLPLNRFLGKDSPVHPMVQATTPMIFRFQAIKLGYSEVKLTGSVFQKRLFNLRLEEPLLDRESDLPVITDDELVALWSQSTDAEPIKHIRPLQRLIAERMTSFSGLTTKVKLVGIMNTDTGELQAMSSDGSQQEIVSPFAWITGHYSMPIKFGPESAGPVIDEQLYRSMHFYAALAHYVNHYEGDRAMNQNRIYSRTRLYLSPKGPESVLSFILVQRQNPTTKEATIGIDRVSLRGFTGLGAFCGSLAAPVVLAEPVTEQTITSFDAETLANLNNQVAAPAIVVAESANPLDM